MLRDAVPYSWAELGCNLLQINYFVEKGSDNSIILVSDAIVL